MNKKKYSLNTRRTGNVDLPLSGSFNAFIAKVVRMCFKAYMAMTETQKQRSANSSLFQNPLKYFIFSFFNFLIHRIKKYKLKIV